MRWHSSVPDVCSEDHTDIDHQAGGSKVKDRLVVNKQGTHKSDMERFNPKKLNEVKGKK
jgi:hypothetical protein